MLDATLQRRALAVTVIGLCGLSPQPAMAQNKPSVDVAAALDCFARDRTMTQVIERCAANEQRPNRVLLRPREYASQVVTGLLDGLQELAISHGNQEVRIFAALELARVGLATRDVSRRISVISRFGPLYAASDFGVRVTLIGMAPDQAEQADAVRFLRGILESVDSLDALGEAPLWYMAVRSLMRMGDNGRRALQGIHDARSAGHEAARRYLQGLVERGFRDPGG